MIDARAAVDAGASRGRRHRARASCSARDVVATHGGAGARRPSRSRRGRTRRARRLRPRSPCRAAGIPTVHLTCHLGGKPAWNEAHRGFRAGRAAARHGGRRRGDGPVRARRRACATGARLGARGGGRLRLRGAAGARACRGRRRSTAHRRRSGTSPASRGKAFVDFQNDVTAADVDARRIAKASAPSSTSSATPRSAWRPTRARPRTCTGLAIMAALHRHARSRETGTTIFRPPYTPVAIGALRRASPRQGFPPDAPARPSHALGGASRAPCSSRPAPWLRAQYYPAAGRDATGWRPSTARSRRCAAASASATSRRSARSTSRAPTPATFLDRVYINTLLDARRRQGALRPDAARGRLRAWTTARPRGSAEDHFFMTTTTANAGQGDAASRILPSGAVAGARRADGLGHRAMGAVLDRRPALARRAAQPSSIATYDLSNEAFPLSRRAAQSRVGGGIPARLFRISFSGELAYELARAGALRRRR